MFTVDVEQDWGEQDTRAVSEVLPAFLKMLGTYGATATFFVVGQLVDIVRPILSPAGPHEVGSHGLTHQVLSRMAPPGVAWEVGESKRVLEAAGYRIAGFRAPFFASPPCLENELSAAGYSYDASIGRVVPGLHVRRDSLGRAKGGLRTIATSTLCDGLTPFSLTWLRLYHPLSPFMVSNRVQMFYCHLHEFLDDSSGWSRLPRGLRALHRRNSGAPAWRILQQLLERFGPRFVSCQQFMDRALLTDQRLKSNFPATPSPLRARAG